ncbi:MAG: hypothetical protein HY939_01480 [Gammaproteobacteria bacterium]|nr:hypothetical protein [Gammaproteobacteria bacterium]
MTNAPSLELKPSHDTYHELLHAFKQGKPLSLHQMHFLQWHHRQIDNPKLTPLLRYYQLSKQAGSFLLHDLLDKPCIDRLKKRLELTLDVLHHGVELALTPEQVEALKTLATPELVFHHGNAYLTGAPLFHGGVIHVDFFEWGNLFGVVKYEFEMGENEVGGNVLIYFEDKLERTMEACILDYELEHGLIKQYTPIPGLTPEPIQAPAPAPSISVVLPSYPRPTLMPHHPAYDDATD